jgi:hypothetical protein
MAESSLALKIVDILLQVLAALRGRPRVFVRILEEDIKKEVGGLRFEIENRRTIVTSLDPEIRVTYYWGDGDSLRRGRNKYFVREVDRSLQPHVPKILSASADDRSTQYWLSVFRTYSFRPTSGLRTRLRVRDTLLDTLSRHRFYWELIRLRILGRFKSDDGETFDDYRRKQRSRGPH